MDTRVFRRNVDKPSGTLLNCLESLVELGRDFRKMVLFQCSEGFRSLSKKQEKSPTTYYNVLPCITKFTSFIIIINRTLELYIYIPMQLLDFIGFCIVPELQNFTEQLELYRSLASRENPPMPPPRTH